MFTVKYQGTEVQVDFAHAQSNTIKTKRNRKTGNKEVVAKIPQLFKVVLDKDGQPEKVLPTKGITRCFIFKEFVDSDGDRAMQVIADGEAYCNPTDNWSYNEGRRHAMANALQDIDRADRKPFWDTYFETRHGQY